MAQKPNSEGRSAPKGKTAAARKPSAPNPGKAQASAERPAADPQRAATAQTASSLPPLYTAPEALTAARHGGLGLAVPPGFAFARAGYAIPLAGAEMPAAMRSYPIVFSGPQNMPVAITGIRAGENLFIEEDGSWTAPHYVPAYVRRYPFILAGEPDAERLTLCIEPDPERVVPLGSTSDARSKPEPFFEGEGPSEATKRALAFCQEFQTMINATQRVMALIADTGLLQQRQGRITLDGGETANITDFSVIDEAALNALPDDRYLELRRVGALAIVYCHLASMNSWQALIHQARGRA